MKLIDLVNASKGRWVMPLMGYPGARLTGSTLKQNGFNPVLHARSIRKIAETFSPDAVFFMMDLSLEAGALGLPIRYPIHGPAAVEEHPVKAVSDLEPFRVLDPLDDVRLRGYVHTMELMASELSIPKGGYVTGPFTLAGLLMGASELAMATIIDPDLVHEVVRFCEAVCRRYALALVEAGADIIAVLEPTATFLSPQSFATFCGGYVRAVVSAVPAMTILHVCGDSGRLIPEMCRTGVEGLSLDSPVDLAQAAQDCQADMVLIGNIDPVRVMVQAPPEGVAREVRALMQRMAPQNAFVLSTGCDLPYETPLENIHSMMREGRR